MHRTRNHPDQTFARSGWGTHNHHLFVGVHNTAYCFLLARTESFTILAVYLPHGPTKIPSWERIAVTAGSLTGERAIVIGDFNTGKHHVDERGATFIAPEYLDRMASLGFVDAWRGQHPETRDYTWYSPQGNGFRLDHAYLSPRLAPALLCARHVHEPRLAGVTDHAALVVDVEL